MSKLDEFKARLAKNASLPMRPLPQPAFDGPHVPVLLGLVEPKAFDGNRITFALVLVTHGLTLREAHTILGQLAETGRATTALQGADAALAGAFIKYGVRASRCG